MHYIAARTAALQCTPQLCLHCIRLESSSKDLYSHCVDNQSTLSRLWPGPCCPEAAPRSGKILYQCQHLVAYILRCCTWQCCTALVTTHNSSRLQRIAACCRYLAGAFKKDQDTCLAKVLGLYQVCTLVRFELTILLLKHHCRPGLCLQSHQPAAPPACLI